MSGSVPRVSILMTVFNAAPFVGTAIDSVLAQSYHDWELVIVDDGSTDGSTAILSTYQDPRIRVTLLAQNIGRTPALRRAFAMARGTYYAVLDADDVSRKDRLARQVEYLDGHPDVVLIGSWARYIDRQGSEFGYWQPPVDAQDLREFLGWANPIVHSALSLRSGKRRGRIP